MKQYKGVVDYTIKKIALSLVCILIMGILLAFDRLIVQIPLIAVLSVAFVWFVLYLDLAYNEIETYFEINYHEVIYNKTYLFGTINIKHVYEVKEDLIDILNYYKEHQQFSIDFINDLAGALVIFQNK